MCVCEGGWGWAWGVFACVSGCVGGVRGVVCGDVGVCVFK